MKIKKTVKDMSRSVCFDEADMARIVRIAEKSGLSIMAVIKLCVRAGLPELESGRFNPLATQVSKSKAA